MNHETLVNKIKLLLNWPNIGWEIGLISLWCEPFHVRGDIGNKQELLTPFDQDFAVTYFKHRFANSPKRSQRWNDVVARVFANHDRL